jgi:hypothetical protein
VAFGVTRVTFLEPPLRGLVRSRRCWLFLRPRRNELAREVSQTRPLRPMVAILPWCRLATRSASSPLRTVRLHKSLHSHGAAIGRARPVDLGSDKAAASRQPAPTCCSKCRIGLGQKSDRSCAFPMHPSRWLQRPPVTTFYLTLTFSKSIISVLFCIFDLSTVLT